MISETGNIKPNSFINHPLNIKPENFTDISFSKELAALIAEKKKDEDSKDIKKEKNYISIANNYLNQLSVHNNFLNASKNATSLIEDSDSGQNDSINELLINFKISIMKDIKNSLIKLEENLLISNDNLSISLLTDYQNVIQNIKDDFSKAFNVSYDSVEINNNNNKNNIDNLLLKKLEEKINNLTDSNSGD